MKKINITTIVLLIYLIVISVISWPGNKPDANYTEFFSITGITLVIIILLRFVQIKRMKIRKQWKDDEKNDTKK